MLKIQQKVIVLTGMQNADVNPNFKQR